MLKLISAKGLIKGFINKYIFLNVVKYFAENGSQNYLVLQPICIYFSFSEKLSKCLQEHLKECQKKSIKKSSTTDKRSRKDWSNCKI